MAKTNRKLKRSLGQHNKKKRPLGSSRQSPLQQALSFHQAGRLIEAEALYREILRDEPKHPVALLHLGLLAHETDKNEIALQLMRQVISLHPDYVEAYYNLGNVLDDLGQKDDAAACYRQAIALKPDYVEAHYNLGIVLQVQGKTEEAAASFGRATTLQPDFPEAHINLGIALHASGKIDEAVASYQRALSLKPDYAAAISNLGIALKDLDRRDEAIACFRQAIDLVPNYVAAHNNLGIVFKDQGKLDEAQACFRQVIALQPAFAEAHYNLANVLKDQDKLEEAIASYRQALTLKPDHVEAYGNLGNVLRDQGKLEEAITCYRKALALQPDFAEMHSNLLFCLNYLPDQPISLCLEEARNFGRIAASRVKKRFTTWNCSPEPKRLCVGLVSGDFRNHPVGYFLENMLTYLDPNRVKLIAYAANRQEDELTARIRSHFATWNSVAELDPESIARLIHEDRVHVLLDLSGHTCGNRLPTFAWKPAPIQASWLGFPASTGLTEMDYFLADPVSVPESHQKHFIETIWYLPETRLCFAPPAKDNELPVTALPALHNGYITFGCFNLTKINDGVVAAWGRILQLLPQARLRLQGRPINSLTMQTQLQQRLAQEGIAPDRLSFAKQVPRMDYLAAHAYLDIILDTFPFPGGTTTCEALWMGVPTVTLAGKTMLSRQGASLLSCAGLADWVAVDEEDYVAKAIAHATDLEKLNRLRAGLRRQVVESPLFDGPRFARNFEAAVWGMWRGFKKKGS